MTSLGPLVVFAAFCLETGSDLCDPFMSDFSCKIRRIYSIPSQHHMRNMLSQSPTPVSVQELDDNWFSSQAGKTESVKISPLENCTFAFDDGRLLADAIFIIRPTIQIFSGSESHHQDDITDASSKTLEVNADSLFKILYLRASTRSAVYRIKGIAMGEHKKKQVTFILH